jgi:hypothetical protein
LPELVISSTPNYADNFGHRDDMDDPDVRMVYHQVEVFRKNARAAGKL